MSTRESLYLPILAPRQPVGPSPGLAPTSRPRADRLPFSAGPWWRRRLTAWPLLGRNGLAACSGSVVKDNHCGSRCGSSQAPEPLVSDGGGGGLTQYEPRSGSRRAGDQPLILRLPERSATSNAPIRSPSDCRFSPVMSQPIVGQGHLDGTLAGPRSTTDHFAVFLADGGRGEEIPSCWRNSPQGGPMPLAGDIRHPGVRHRIAVTAALS